MDYAELLKTDNAPSIAIIAPAYNEEATIVQNVKSLLSLQYPNFTIIVVNDGSKDHTLQSVIHEYSLKKVNSYFEQAIDTSKVRGVYKSTNQAFSSLVVVDKENGGKADALNVGLNISESDYVACIDVDCMLEEDSLQRMIKPFLAYNEKKVIAVGGVVKVANSCVIENGKLIEARVPSKFLPKVQILEYIRAFIMGRMGWRGMNGLLLISGAFGVFDRKIAVSAGGYNPKTVGEDMELIVRMRRYMEELKEPYIVDFIPDPLCWTEVPESKKILLSQRNRWTRGTIETLWMHRKVLFNPKYHFMGLVSFPYWLFFEWMAPIVEFLGLIYFFYLWIFEGVYWLFFFSLLAAVYLFAIMFSSFALLVDDISYDEYKKPKDILKLVVVSLLEPIIFHPFVVWAAIKGNWTKLTGKQVHWGTMVRKGFDAPNK